MSLQLESRFSIEAEWLLSAEVVRIAYSRQTWLELFERLTA